MRWLKRILVLIAVLAIVAGIAFLGFMGIFLYSFSHMEGGFFLYQDCMMLRRVINGRVQNKNGEPIVDAKLHIYTRLGFEDGRVDLNITTDGSGRFKPTGIDVYACDILVFEIAATGYATKTLEFTAAQEQVNSVGDQNYYGDPDYTTTIAYGQTPVLPRQIIIELP